MNLTKLTSDNHKDVIELFGNEVSNYYFIIEDLIRNDYKGENFHVYGEYDNGKLVSILLNNFDNVTYYSNFDRDVDIYKDILNKLTFSKLSGDSRLIKKFLPYVKVESDTLSYMGVVKEVKKLRKYPNLVIKTIDSKQEIGKQYDLLLSAEEYKNILPKSKDEYIEKESERISNSSGRTVYLSVDDEMISSCSTVMEGEKSAIIIGVVTNPKFRNKGYGTEVLIAAFNMLLEEGKYPYLFYNNPAARSVYKKIGMTEVCEWKVVRVND